MLSQEKVDNFWVWFEQHATCLRIISADSDLFVRFEDQLDILGIKSWEIGPSESKPGCLFFAVSLDDNPESIPIIEEMIAAAPQLDNWEFLVGKPPKVWDRIFIWGDDQKRVDAKDWKFSLRRYPDGLHDVILLSPGLQNFSEDELLSVADFVVEAEIGERLFVEAVYSIKVDQNPGKDFESAAIIGIAQLRSAMTDSFVKRKVH